MSNLKKRLRNVDLDVKLKNNPNTILTASEGILGGTQGYNLAQWLADKFNHNFDAYDKAIDSIYNQTHIGGSAYHHILDGQHSIWGAFKAVQDVKIDDSWATELGQAMEHLIRDIVSISGINPFFSLSPEQFEKLGNLVANIGISKEYLADALTINGPELLGGSVALVGAIIMGKKASPDRLSYFSGGCLLSSIVSANPALLPIAAGSMAYAIYKGKNRKELFVQAGKGSIVSGSALLVSSLVGGPAWLGCVAGFMTAIAVQKCLENPQKALEFSQKLIQPARNVLRSVSYNF